MAEQSDGTAIPIGKDYQQVIEAALDEAACAIVVCPQLIGLAMIGLISIENE